MVYKRLDRRDAIDVGTCEDVVRHGKGVRRCQLKATWLGISGGTGAGRPAMMSLCGYCAKRMAADPNYSHVVMIPIRNSRKGK